MDQIILSLLQGLLPLLQQALAAKEANDKTRHDAIVKEMNEKLLAAYAAVNGLEPALLASDTRFREDLHAYAKKIAAELQAEAVKPSDP